MAVPAFLFYLVRTLFEGILINNYVLGKVCVFGAFGVNPYVGGIDGVSCQRIWYDKRPAVVGTADFHLRLFREFRAVAFQ